MTTPPLTEKLVYLTLQGVFVGEDSHIRKRKAIRNTIRKHHTNAEIRALTLKYNIDTISTMAKTLLEDQIFASKAKAKLRFPDIFESPTTKSRTLKPAVATSSATAIQPTVTSSDTASSSAAAAQHAVGVDSPEELVGIGDTLKARKEREKIENTNSQMQLFNSVALPLWDQHRLLVRVQYTLEKACFAFAQKNLGGLLQREGWDCAEAVELNRWARPLLLYREELRLDDVKDITKPLPILMDSITQLRHNAVHRVQLSSSGLLQHLTDAGLLAQLLQDGECTKMVSTIRQKTQDAFEELVRNKQLLDGRLANIKKDFAAKRAELERQEAALLEVAVKEHKRPVISVSGSLGGQSDGIGSTTEEAHAPWLRVYDAARPDNESSASEGMDEPTAKPRLEDEATNATDGDVASSTPVLPVPPQPVDGDLIEPVMHPGQQEVKRSENKGLPIEGNIPTHSESEFDDYESTQKHPLDLPLLNQERMATNTGNATEEHEKELEISDVSDCEDANFQDCDPEALYEPSTSLASTCVGKSENDAEEAHHESPNEDEICTRPGQVEDETRTNQSVAVKNDPTFSLPATQDKKNCEGSEDTSPPPGYESIVNAVIHAINHQHGSEWLVSPQGKIEPGGAGIQALVDKYGGDLTVPTQPQDKVNVVM